MIYLLYGKDTYRSRKKLNEIVEEYRKKTGSGLNYYYLDADENGIPELKNVLETSSLFSPKKLVVAKNYFSQDIFFDAVVRILASIKDEANMIIVSWDSELCGEAKKRFQEIEALADKAQEFPLLENTALTRWIAKEAGARGITLSRNKATQLALKGGNLWAIANELDKIAVSIEESNEGESKPSTVFQLGDAFFFSRRETLYCLHTLLAQGEKDFHLFGYVGNYVRTVLAVKVSAAQGKTPAGVSPYVVKKVLALIPKIPPGKLPLLLQRFYEEDCKIKIGLSKPKDSLIQILFETT